MSKIKSIKIKEIYLKTKSIKETAKFFGVTPQGISWRVKKMGIFKKEWTIRKKNGYIDMEDYVILFSKNGEEIFVDKQDFKKVKRYKWCISKTGYAVANIQKRVTKMHRFILGLKCGEKIVDHIDRNKLNNRRSNLRFCTRHQNSMNCNETKNRKLPLGIRIRNGKYVARIMLNKKEINLGRYYNIEDAIKARKNAEKLYFNGFRT